MRGLKVAPLSHVKRGRDMDRKGAVFVYIEIAQRWPVQKEEFLWVFLSVLLRQAALAGRLELRYAVGIKYHQVRLGGLWTGGGDDKGRSGLLARVSLSRARVRWLGTEFFCTDKDKRNLCCPRTRRPVRRRPTRSISVAGREGRRKKTGTGGEESGKGLK